MTIFQFKNQKLIPVREVGFDLEKDIQKITENNLETAFGLEFVASEFNLENFWIDTLAFNPEAKAFVIIEYKKKRNLSIMDQGQTYLNLVLDHKAEVVLGYNERKNKNLTRKDVNWDQTRVMFISPEFTTYQKRALHPKLPFELWEVKKYEGNLIVYNQIQPLILARAGQSVSSLCGSAAKEIKVYTEEDVLKKCSSHQREIMRTLMEIIEEMGGDIQKMVGKDSIGYKTQRAFVNIGPRSGLGKKGVRVYFASGARLKDGKGILKGRGREGRYLMIDSLKQIPEIEEYIKQAYENSKN